MFSEKKSKSIFLSSIRENKAKDNKKLIPTSIQNPTWTKASKILNTKTTTKNDIPSFITFGLPVKKALKENSSKTGITKQNAKNEKKMLEN